jgi:hypothetical protein
VSQCDIPVSQCDIPVSQCDIPVSQCDIPVSQRDIPRVAARHPPCRSATPPVSRCGTDHFAVQRTPRQTVQREKTRAPLTSRRGEPDMPGTNPSLESVEGLAANGGTRVLNKDSEVRTECGS